jgi:DNA-binding winged helix-turn-helix (wHTH) protein
MRVRFAEFTFDRRTRELLRGAEALHLEPKAFDLLDLLLARRPEAVSRRDLQERLWPGTFVSDGSLTGLMTQIRQALQDPPRQSRFIRTVHGFGYAFSGTAMEQAVPALRGHRGPCVVWDRRVLPLEKGENVLGRAEDAAVRIDAPGVSRFHARIVVTEAGALLEDLGSKNGTYLGDRRLEGPAPLAEGDVFSLGRQALLFHRAVADDSTATEPDR